MRPRTKEYKGEGYTAYEASQKQRSLETAMRAKRQQIQLLKEGSADPNDIIITKCKLRAIEQEYIGFSAKMGLPQQLERVMIEGAKTPATKGLKLKKTVDKAQESGIIKARGQKFDIEGNTTKLKGSMNGDDYSEYLERLNNHLNTSIKKLYSSHADEIAEVKKIANGGTYTRVSNSITYSYPDEHYIQNGKDKYSTVAHEYGHFFDAKCTYDDLHFTEIDAIRRHVPYSKSRFKQNASSSDEFLAAVRKDKSLLRGILTNEVKEELKIHDASSGVQDAIDGLLGQRIRWGHGDKYYNRTYSGLKQFKEQKDLQYAYVELGFDASSQAKVARICRDYESASEMWANIIEAETNSGESLEYVRKYLPNSYGATIKILKGAQ